MKRFRAMMGTSLLSVLLSGCAVYAGGYGGYYYDPYDPAVPEGHLPPPGECRIWYPDRPAGQQPPPGPCHELRHRVPVGATLIRG